MGRKSRLLCRLVGVESPEGFPTSLAVGALRDPDRRLLGPGRTLLSPRGGCLLSETETGGHTVLALDRGVDP